MTTHEAPGRRPQILIGASGALQVLTLPEIIARFRTSGPGRIGVVLTPSAEAMTSVAAITAIADEVITRLSPERNHISLAREYDVLVVFAATANFLSAVATGAARNSLELILLAMGRPAIIVPTMNKTMWNARAVQRNAAQIRADGHLLLEPSDGRVYEGARRELVPGTAPPSVEEIVSTTLEHLASRRSAEQR